MMQQGLYLYPPLSGGVWGGGGLGVGGHALVSCAGNVCVMI